jgi:hypothetical protein
VTTCLLYSTTATASGPGGGGSSQSHHVSRKQQRKDKSHRSFEFWMGLPVIPPLTSCTLYSSTDCQVRTDAYFPPAGLVKSDGFSEGLRIEMRFI